MEISLETTRENIKMDGKGAGKSEIASLQRGARKQKSKGKLRENGDERPMDRQLKHKRSRNRQKLAFKPSLNDTDLCPTFQSPKKQAKVSLNHLLNFSFPERHQPGFSYAKKSTHPVFNKEKFVNANYRFVMEPGYDGSEHVKNADVFVKWESVCQIIVPTNKPISCPICLETPLAPRVTKCGHIFCFPCLQHYLTLSEHSWRKCPICFDSIYSAALKAVKILQTEPIEGVSLYKPTPVDFVLMKRSTQSTVALPVMSHKKINSVLPDSSVPLAETFAKIMCVDKSYIRAEILDQDIGSLESYLEKHRSETTKEGSLDYQTLFVEQCLEDLKAQKIALEMKYHDIVPANGRGANSGDAYYFYQAANGQHIYLHPLYIKILKFEFGDYADFPTHVRLPVISIRESTITNDLRKRCKYLSHLPLTCDISFCEADLLETVSVSTSMHFQSEISERLKDLAKQQKKKNSERKISPRIGLEDYQEYTPIETPSFDYSKDFGPALSSSPEYPPIASTASTPPTKSFAAMAIENFHSLPSSWQKAQPKEQTGWRLDIPEDILTSAPSKGKKRGKKIVLLGNGGSRGRS